MARESIGETWDTHRPGLTRRVQTNPTAAPPQPQEPTSAPAEPEAQTLPTAAPDEQTNEQPAETSAEELTPPSRFVLSAEPRDGELQPGETGAVVLTAINPVGNSTDMELVLTLAAADGLEITDPSGQFDPRTGTGVYTAAPGAEAAVRLDVSAPSPGRYTISGTGRVPPARRGDGGICRAQPHVRGRGVAGGGGRGGRTRGSGRRRPAERYWRTAGPQRQRQRRRVRDRKFTERY